MTGEWREFTFTADACPSRPLDGNDIDHLQVVADRSKSIHDVVFLFDDESKTLTSVFQLVALEPGTAAVRGCENIRVLLSTIGLTENKVRIDSISVEPATFDESDEPMSREDFGRQLEPKE